MRAMICNKAHPDLGCATIPLPIPDEEYGRGMELLEQMRIGNAAANDCYGGRKISSELYAKGMINTRNGAGEVGGGKCQRLPTPLSREQKTVSD